MVYAWTPDLNLLCGLSLTQIWFLDFSCDFLDFETESWTSGILWYHSLFSKYCSCIWYYMLLYSHSNSRDCNTACFSVAVCEGSRVTWLVIAHKSDIMTSARAVIAWIFLNSNVNNVRLLISGKLSELVKTIKQSCNNIIFLWLRILKIRYLFLTIWSINLSKLFYIVVIQLYSLLCFPTQPHISLWIAKNLRLSAGMFWMATRTFFLLFWMP